VDAVVNVDIEGVIVPALDKNRAAVQGSARPSVDRVGNGAGLKETDQDDRNKIAEGRHVDRC